MRKKDLIVLEQPYNDLSDSFDNRFQLALKADIKFAELLEKEIFSDLDIENYGISWWKSLPVSKRILIGDYLYQCVAGIEVNFVEAKLHYLEWLDARENDYEKVMRLFARSIPSTAPIDDLYRRLEELHICGFFRAIGSALDCLGASIVGVLGLPISLRKSDIGKAEKALLNVKSSENDSSDIQIKFKNHFDAAKRLAGVKDWLEWTDQYRNMYVHRGRRVIFHLIKSQKSNLLASKGMSLTSTKLTTHLAKYPDRTDIEAFIKGKDINLYEDAEDTIFGIFNSSKSFCEKICERLVDIWQLRRTKPTLIEQPASQWDNKIRNCSFNGYNPKAKKPTYNTAVVNPLLGHRMEASSVLDNQRSFWDDSDWS